MSFSHDGPPVPQSSAVPQPSDSSTPQPPAVISSPNENEGVKPHRKPLLRLEIRDLSSSGTHAFLRLLHASDTISEAVDIVLSRLYTGLPRHCILPTRSVTLVLRSMPGVAYTTSKDLDDDHKEIHFSTDYINGVPEGRQKEEMRGVIVHEMVHCWQHNAYGTAPGGLIEGIADWVRLKAGLGPPHWKRRADCDWDAGYERTGFFLEYLEGQFGADVVRKINDTLREREYEEHAFWMDCCGRGVKELWEEYQRSLEEYETEAKKEEELPTDRHS
ncbi:BSP-domain-containing protein [Polyplosphaeria fusca]|uniref:BSP-domain-containing protein n=1 Tax=Polyplosphaeria fusca TaxID=682080 RepID=A0A9P4QQY6_9PLEO|nr:BSP-domain-containing protein [Polyplosphaeria fusca]